MHPGDTIASFAFKEGFISLLHDLDRKCSSVKLIGLGQMLLEAGILVR